VFLAGIIANHGTTYSTGPAANVLANLYQPHLPTRAEICDRAMAMFAKTSSMDDIVDMPHMLILDAIGARVLPPQNLVVSRS
jgi:hypothetical protein